MTPNELRRQRIAAQEKDTRAVIRRDFSASRMSTTKWRAVAEALGGLRAACRVKFVDGPQVFGLPAFWHVTGDWFDSGALGPFTSVSVEWLEVDRSEEAEKRLRAAGVPFHAEAGRLVVIGHVREAPASGG